MIAIADVFNILGISLGLIIMGFLCVKREKHTSDYLLIIMNGLLVIQLLADTQFMAEVSGLVFVAQNLINFFFFPTFMWFALLFLTKEKHVQRNWSWVAVGVVSFVLFLAYDFLFWHGYEPGDLARLCAEPLPAYQFFYKGHSIFVVCSLIWLLRRFKIYQDTLKSNYSDIEPLRLNGLRNITVLYLCLTILVTLVYLAYNFNWLASVDIPLKVLDVGLLLTLFYLSYFGVRDRTLYEFAEKRVESLEGQGVNPFVNPTPPTKYQSSSLAGTEMDSLYAQVLKLLEEDEIYQIPQLQIQDLADRLGVTTHRISQTINSKAGKSFYDLINGYRVAHLKRLLLAPEYSSFTILGLGLESGFNSKASLNRIFKQHTGVSPSEFQRSHPAKVGLNFA